MGRLGAEHWTCRAARNELAPGELIAGSSPSEMPECAPWQTRNRRMTCGRYNTCLNFAMRAKWKSWECGGCTGYEPMTTEQAARDSERIPLLVLKAFVAKPGQRQRGNYAQAYRVSRGRKRRSEQEP